jgi:hypothetical protein
MAIKAAQCGEVAPGGNGVVGSVNDPNVPSAISPTPAATTTMDSTIFRGTVFVGFAGTSADPAAGHHRR